jgi:SsrA-binding protein
MKITNKAAFHDYSIQDRFEAGIKLTGPEVKSIKTGHVSLKGAFVRIVGAEAYLVNSMIPPYTFARVLNYDPNRTRKLLIHKSQLMSLKGKLTSDNLTLVPISLYTRHGLVKVEVGVGRGKKQFEKREALKKRQEKRELDRAFRGKVR